MRWRLLSSTAAMVWAGGVDPLLTPVSAQVAEAAATITASEIARHIGVIAADSMQGRDTPSRGLELTAQYIAKQFQQAGLTAYSDDGTWFQRYPTVVTPKPELRFIVGDKQAVHEASVQLLGTDVPTLFAKTSAVLLAGQHTAHTLSSDALSNKIVLYIPPLGLDSAGQRQVVEALVAANKSVGVVVLADDTPAPHVTTQTILRHRADRPRTWALRVSPKTSKLGRAFETTVNVLRAVDLDLARIRADSAPVVRDLPTLTITFNTKVHFEIIDSGLTAPNVVGLLKGSDSKLKHELVVISTHMDYIGLKRDDADSVWNGANEASGPAGLMALAQAFNHSGARPRRSVLFVAVSGGRKGLWGSTHYLTNYANEQAWAPLFRDPVKPMTMESIVANVNLDMISGTAGDSLTINGLAELELPTPLTWVITAHPELGSAVSDGGTAFIPESDHFAFLQKGVPALYIHNGTHEGARAKNDDAPSTIDAEQTARNVRLAFYLGLAVANADTRPRWSAAARRQYLELVRQPE